jgi:hypothetical protein
MVKRAQIEKELNVCRDKILSAAELALPKSKFEIFRKTVLDAMGNKGFNNALNRLFKGEQERKWNG